MHIRVLGSAAGGGFPQWNDNGENCKGLRAGNPNFKARNQSSITVSANGEEEEFDLRESEERPQRRRYPSEKSSCKNTIRIT